MYDRKFNENCVSARLRLYEILKTKLSMPHPPGPDSLKTCSIAVLHLIECS